MYTRRIQGEHDRRPHFGYAGRLELGDRQRMLRWQMCDVLYVMQPGVAKDSTGAFPESQVCELLARQDEALFMQMPAHGIQGPAFSLKCLQASGCRRTRRTARWNTA